MKESTFEFNFFRAFIVGIIILISALILIYVRNLNRQLFYQLQLSQQYYDELQVEWGRLLLERSAWAAPARIEALAASELDMKAPQQKHFIILSNKLAE